MIYSLDPLVGAVISSLVLREPFGPCTVLGAVLVLGGCIYSSVGTQSDPAVRSEAGEDLASGDGDSAPPLSGEEQGLRDQSSKEHER